MSDLISRQVAIEALYDWEMTYDWDDHCREEDPKPEYIVSPSDVIEKLPSAQQHWIPCGERLPEERGFYLTTTKDKAVYCDYWNEDNFDRTEMVIAWMPLPEPYKGGGR